MVTSYKLLMVRDGAVKLVQKPVTGPGDADAVLREYIGQDDRERFVVMALNTRGRVIGLHTAHVGTLSECIIHPREVFKFAVAANADRVLLAHNHPSGDPAPSPEDNRMYQRLVEAGALLGIEVLDHIIVGEHGCYSTKGQRVYPREAEV